MNDAQLQVMWNRLLSVVEEQGQTLIRAAFSPIVRECGDISAGIFDFEGRMLAQAVTGTPGHINTMAEAVKTLRQRFPVATMRPGDIYMTNDPWLASGHLNDFLLLMPVYLGNQVVGFTSCTSHLIDLGGLGMGPEGSDVYDEGLLLPPCKLVDQGELNPLLMEIVRANSREPIANEGDIYALVACCESGAKRLLTMMQDFDIDTLDVLADYIIKISRRGTLDAIAAIPYGTYTNKLIVDGYDAELELHCQLTINKHGVTADFSGTSPCTNKGINVPLNYATAYTVFGLRCIIGPEIPNNAGSLEPFRVTAPEGCILNAIRPAPVAMRHTLGQMTPDLVLGCLHQALPDEVPAEGASCMYDLPLRHTADAAMQGWCEFAVELVHNGGTGARPGSDGLSATAYPSGVFGSQVEITEAVAPVIVWRRELLADSGGAGEFRGGLGQHIELCSAVDEPFLVFLSVERIKNPAKGRDGGMSGRPGSIRITGRKTGIHKVSPAKGDSNEHPGVVVSEETESVTIAGKCVCRVEPGERLLFDTPGGGGFGSPLNREPEYLHRDIAEGIVSADAAVSDYGQSHLVLDGASAGE